MNRKVPVYLYGETESFMEIPFETFSVLQRGDMLSIAGSEGVGIKAYMVRYKESHIWETSEPGYALQVEEW